MSNHVYKHIEITGSSSESLQQAIENGIQKASESVRNMRWFQVIDSRGSINGYNISQWQVTLKVGFTLE